MPIVAGNSVPSNGGLSRPRTGAIFRVELGPKLLNRLLLSETGKGKNGPIFKKAGPAIKGLDRNLANLQQC